MSQQPPPYPPYPPAPPPPPPPGQPWPPPPAHPQWPYGMPPPAGRPPTSNTTVALILVLAIVGVLLVGTVATGLGYLYLQGSRSGVASSSPIPTTPSPSPGVTAYSKLRVDQGRIVFSDDFRGPTTGWFVGTYSSGTSFRYSSDGYVVVAKGYYTTFVDAPSSARPAQVSLAVTGTQAGDAPAYAGFGVSCVTEAGSILTRFALIVTRSGGYEILRFSPDAPGTIPDELTFGPSPLEPGTSPMTLVGVCAFLSDNRTIRLALFAGHTLVADITDTLDSSVGRWSGGLAFESAASHSSTDTITNFVERDLNG